MAITPAALRVEPELAALIAEAIARWSAVESQMGKLLAEMLGTAARRGNAMFAALSSSTAQFAVIRGVAAEVFKARQRELDLFTVIMQLAKVGASKRNKLAHHLWGLSPDLPGRLLLMDPRDNLAMSIADAERMREEVEAYLKESRRRGGRIPKKRLRQLESQFEPPPYPPEQIWVYSSADLVECSDYFDQVEVIIGEFQLFAPVDWRGMSVTVERSFDQLEALPLVAPALRRLRERRKSSPEAPPQSPDEDGK